MDWERIREKAEKQSKIVVAIFEAMSDEDNLFNCLTVHKLGEVTGIKRQTLWRQLRELSDERREGWMALEAVRIERRIDSTGAGSKLGRRMRRSLRYPTLVAMDKAYTLHPETKRLMEHGWRPFVPKNSEEAFRLLEGWKNPPEVLLKLRRVK